MDELTVQNLNQLNTEFYTVVGESFSATRGDYWQGWDELLPFLSEPPQLKLVDFGCGNGRFLQFVSENIQKPVEYLGIDSSDVLLKLAEQSTGQLKNDLAVSFITGDLVKALSEGTLTLPRDTAAVTLFGVLHHIPSFKLRKRLFELLAAQLAAGSLLILSSWQFAAHERFQKKFLPVPAEIDHTQLEEDDYFLGWQDHPSVVRYCHYCSPAELQKLINPNDWHVRAQFSADGTTRDLNIYLVLERIEQ